MSEIILLLDLKFYTIFFFFLETTQYEIHVEVDQSLLIHVAFLTKLDYQTLINQIFQI